ncbi:MAG: NADH-quinone oxidoreductase subunit G [Gammaproteobacteria bacterium]|nr:MAG: NADH-quinone oxidoreductase subunit G [Gammaproteobacteria bacterium]RLA62022.1 MAG: NADH-quinone oxidoreductase subunit G [Gammaproteobacteria bacterium]
MPVIQVDGQEYEVEAGKNLLEACLSLGLDLPYFCWHPAMGSIGACRQCAVVQYLNAEDERGRIVMGCMTPVTDGAIFSLSGDKARGFRQAIVESLMLNHPHDCPVCAEGGECHLQDMTVMVGHRDRHYRGRKNTHRNQYLGPLINHEMNRCITCYRCTRYYRDYAGGTDLAALASRDHVYFGRHSDGVLQSEFAGNLLEVCPTGVFTDKSLVHNYTRKWDLQSAPSVCVGCAMGCNTLPGERYGKIKRVHNRFNAEVNGYFLCDRGRFGAGFVHDERRLQYPGLRNNDGRYDAINHHEALQYMDRACAPGKVAGIGSPRASVEANFLLRTLVGEENFAPGFSDAEQPLVELVLRLQQDSRALVPDITTIESADAVLILGEDLTNTAPRIALALRQSVRNKAYEMAAELRLETWQDGAIRNLAQDQRSPLYIAAVADTPLDDVATNRISLAPDDIARLGNAIAANIAGQPNADLEQPLQEQVEMITTALAGAQRPLVLSGTGCGSTAVLAAAGQVADALCGNGVPAMLCLAVPEANSLGQALLTGCDAPGLAQLQQRAASGEFDTLVVLENDLYRRGSSAQIDQLLGAFQQVLVLDGLDNQTTSSATLALPAASFAESNGTLISLEGRAQHHYPVFQPHAERRPSWTWLLACMKEMQREEVRSLHHFDDITRACAATIPALAGITAAAPDHHFRNAGVRIPRQTHRYSGRTAMRADISVHEPRQPVDEESPLAFSMEGLNRDQPGALLPYVWAPGWNSNQSLHKFQAEVGGPLKGGTAGARLLQSGIGAGPGTFTAPAPFKAEPGRWQLVPRQRIFGSDELSALSPGLAELVQPGFIEICAADAQLLGVTEGDGLVVTKGITKGATEGVTTGVDNTLATLEARINDSMAVGCAGFSVGLAGVQNLRPLAPVSLRRAEGWQRRSPELIGSDRDAGPGGTHV